MQNGCDPSQSKGSACPLDGSCFKATAAVSALLPFLLLDKGIERLVTSANGTQRKLHDVALKYEIRGITDIPLSRREPGKRLHARVCCKCGTPKTRN